MKRKLGREVKLTRTDDTPDDEAEEAVTTAVADEESPQPPDAYIPPAEGGDDSRAPLEVYERSLLRQALDLLEKRASAVWESGQAIGVSVDEAQDLLYDITNTRAGIPAMAGDYWLERGQRACIASALLCYLTEIGKTAKKELALGIQTNDSTNKRLEIAALARKIGLNLPVPDAQPAALADSPTD